MVEVTPRRSGIVLLLSPPSTRGPGRRAHSLRMLFFLFRFATTQALFQDALLGFQGHDSLLQDPYAFLSLLVEALPSFLLGQLLAQTIFASFASLKAASPEVGLSTQLQPCRGTA